MKLCNIEDLAGHIPAPVGERVDWADIISSSEENQLNYCKVLNGKTFFISYTSCKQWP
jgi:hypothetical protein